jgi:hypothetical protein
VLIQAFGLFWRADEIDWEPGSGGRARDGLPRSALLGHRGTNAPSLRVVDFWDQRGIYILYGNYGAHYVGLNSSRGLGVRLKEHRRDRHAGLWDRFSWFGFRRALKGRNWLGVSELAEVASYKAVQSHPMIREMEALLIHALGVQNLTKTRFPGVVEAEWKQVLRLERPILLERLTPGPRPVKRRTALRNRTRPRR